MTNRIRLLTAVAALALPGTLVTAQTTQPAPTPPATGTPAAPDSGLPPVPSTTDSVPDPVTEPPQEPTQATDPAAPTPDADADAAAEQQAQQQVQQQPMPTQQPVPAETQTTTTTTQTTTTAQTQPQAGTPAPAGQITQATAADVRTGVQVRDTTGGLVGTIESVDASGAVVSTGTARAKIPVASFGRNNQGLVISMNKAELEAAVAASSRPPAT